MELEPEVDALGGEALDPEEPLPDHSLPGLPPGPLPTMMILLAFMEQMMDLMGKVTESVTAASSSLMKVDVRKGHPIKIPLPKLFAGNYYFEVFSSWLREMENFFCAMGSKMRPPSANNGPIIEWGCIGVVVRGYQRSGHCR